jgi:hypothetical protein
MDAAATDTHNPAAMYECWLKELPDVMNDLAANAAISECRRLHPEEVGPMPAKESRWFGYASSTECTADKAKRTPSAQAARGIAAACTALY